MTRDEIMALSPEEVNREIWKAQGHQFYIWHTDSNGKDWWVNTTTQILMSDYASDIAAAWELIDQPGAYLKSNFGFYFAGIFKYGNNIKVFVSAKADTAPLAICRAWLIWRSEQEKTE